MVDEVGQDATWPTVRLHDGRPATGYVLSRRTGLLSSAPLSGGSCAGLLTNGRYLPVDAMVSTQIHLTSRRHLRRITRARRTARRVRGLTP